MGASNISGPFTVDELNECVRSGAVTPDWLATGDIGETSENVRQSGDWDWIYLGTVPGVVGLAVPSARLRTWHWSRVQTVLIIIVVMVLIPYRDSVRNKSSLCVTAALGSLNTSGLTNRCSQRRGGVVVPLRGSRPLARRG